MESLLNIFSKVRFDIVIPLLLILLAVLAVIIVIYLRHALSSSSFIKQSKTKKESQDQDLLIDIMQILSLEFTEIRMD